MPASSISAMGGCAEGLLTSLDAFRSAGDLGLALADRLSSEQVGVDGRADEVADRIDGVGGRLASLFPPGLSGLAGNFTPLLRAESLGPCAPAFQAAQAAKRYGMGVLLWCERGRTASGTGVS